MKATACLILAAIGTFALWAQGSMSPQETASPGDSASKGLAVLYQSVADSILANKRSEKALVRTILEVKRDLTLAALDQAAAQDPPSVASLRTAAQHLGDFATEGGAEIEPVRSRLLQGGHHHHAQDSGPEAVYDRGYVVLTKALKREALELAKTCAQLAESDGVGASMVATLRRQLASLAERVLADK